MQPQPTIVLLERDLLFTTRITRTARGMGCRCVVASTGGQWVQDAHAALTEGAPVLLMANVAGLAIPWEGLDALHITQRAPLLGYCPHVETELRAAALAAGFDRVISNSRLSEALPDVLRRYFPTLEQPAADASGMAAVAATSPAAPADDIRNPADAGVAENSMEDDMHA